MENQRYFFLHAWQIKEEIENKQKFLREHSKKREEKKYEIYQKRDEKELTSEYWLG